MFRNNHRFLAGLFVLCSAASAYALPDDWQQEMVILSDHAELDRKAGVVIYEGNVILTQGTLRIESERLLIIRTDNTLEKAVAEGTAKKPARYQQQINPGKPLTKAHGQRIDYFARQREVNIQGNAQLQQDGNLFSGERILYDMTKETVSASGGTSTSGQTGGNGEKQRIKVVIQPQAPAEPATDNSKPVQEQP
ncbi:lipopolysaccharide transport periplasmic protein LptA [Thalassolituus sp. ST750PaO-4]|jgi:lipopolysaccharide export system protein LptA|uniref:lipopolysaccharide transport periplasmic protein LptA n=1 Tax=Thalassolituus sp. ST750PaO-4 TaxID=2742965 RepID=UPI000C471F2D|nr:lipopolysaccharide transport periplasmic protein LptA [Thalassolituus sp. ST750PaO-4]MCA6060028.1 lipopolysaccharide transport periplasmic protein LptA [Thalassolituus sp. ST750PaO-4]PIQ39837.1 MAG: lipopolysaccharide transport periplasmic protein LptA [Thalassolituus sp. CG17_big_fil_post_rev_8_21_14_2_50_53_8]|tara:strand:- start:1316 stop:1897 length:582 start_codon:yes stop_codon:yes gene_type:complete